jgi:hypothetical protein
LEEKKFINRKSLIKLFRKYVLKKIIQTEKISFTINLMWVWTRVEFRNVENKWKITFKKLNGKMDKSDNFNGLLGESIIWWVQVQGKFWFVIYTNGPKSAAIQCSAQLYSAMSNLISFDQKKKNLSFLLLYFWFGCGTGKQRYMLFIF